MLGCFGSALCYQPGSGACEPCAFRAGCAAEVARRVGKEAFHPALRRPTVEEARVVSNQADAPERVKLELRRLLSKGLTLDGIRADLGQRVNPLRRRPRPAFVNTAFEALVSDLGLNSQRLQATYRQSGMSRATARSSAAIAIGLIATLNVAANDDDTWRIK